MNNKYLIKAYKPCHEPTEIYPNFWICGASQVFRLLHQTKFDILIPLNSLDGKIWDYITPQETQIFYFPIKDYDVLETNELNYLIDYIVKQLNNGKKICLFCGMGHGRTGYITSCVLGKMGFKDPIGYIRQYYCKEAIETSKQIESIMNFLPELRIVLYPYLEEQKEIDKYFEDYILGKSCSKDKK